MGSDCLRKRDERERETAEHKAERQRRDAEAHRLRRHNLGAEQKTLAKDRGKVATAKWRKLGHLFKSDEAMDFAYPFLKHPMAPKGVNLYVVAAIPDAEPWLHCCEQPTCREHTFGYKSDYRNKKAKVEGYKCRAGHVQSGDFGRTNAIPVRITSVFGARYAAAVLDDAVAQDIPGMPPVSSTRQLLRAKMAEFMPVTCALNIQHNNSVRLPVITVARFVEGHMPTMTQQ